MRKGRACWPSYWILEIVTPERQLVHEQVSDMQLPGKDGYLGILPGHAALLGQLGAGCAELYGGRPVPLIWL